VIVPPDPAATIRELAAELESERRAHMATLVELAICREALAASEAERERLGAMLKSDTWPPEEEPTSPHHDPPSSWPPAWERDE
jgi:hypothetical protein